jgi:hypothetical protein
MPPMFQIRSESPRSIPKYRDDRSTVIDEPTIVAEGADTPFIPEVKSE